MCIDILFSYVHLLNTLLFCLEGEGKMKKNCIRMFFFLEKNMVLCWNIYGACQIFVKEPTLECGFWLIIEGYIVFLFEFVSLFISGCCLATIYPNTTSPLIPIHVIILKCLVSSAKETWFVDMCLKQCELWYEIKLSHIYSFLNGLTNLDCAGVSPPPGQ